MTPDPVAPSPGGVVLELPASTAGVAVVRATVAAVVAGLGATVDDVDDVRVAASEACTLVIERAVPGSRLTVRIDGDRDRVTLDVAAPVVDAGEPLESTFAWTVLTALVPEADAVLEDGVLRCRFTHRPTVPA